MEGQPIDSSPSKDGKQTELQSGLPDSKPKFPNSQLGNRLVSLARIQSLSNTQKSNKTSPIKLPEGLNFPKKELKPLPEIQKHQYNSGLNSLSTGQNSLSPSKPPSAGTKRSIAPVVAAGTQAVSPNSNPVLLKQASFNEKQPLPPISNKKTKFSSENGSGESKKNFNNNSKGVLALIDAVKKDGFEGFFYLKPAYCPITEKQYLTRNLYDLEAVEYVDLDRSNGFVTLSKQVCSILYFAGYIYSSIVFINLHSRH